MKYAVNQEGIDALRTMATAISESAESLNELVNGLRSSAEDYESTLGPHVDSMYEALDDIGNILKKATEPVDSISSKLNDVAEGYEEVIENDRFANLGK